MTFEEILDQSLDMLRRHGRVTYGALKRQFGLDDAYLADLKDALLYADAHVVDDAGRGLRWTGAPLSTAQRAFEGAARFYGEAGVLWLVRALLQHEGRVSYRTLRQVFGFDEARLADVRAELLFTRCAIDEDGQGLMWTGRASADSALGETTDTILLATAERAATPPLAPTRGTAEAERRQLTVLFCDLVDSTRLSQQLDPEDLRQVVRAYQETAAEVIQHFEGHIAQYLGDGLLVYFGYPRAHENDAQRAVHTGLGIVEALGMLNNRLWADYGVELAVRLGLHTGPVVVGAMGGGGRYEHLALGETPNIAARLEGLAAPNAVVISAVTAQLVQRAFVLEALGTQALKGITEPMAVWRVVGPLETLHEATTPVSEDVKPLVGRGEEVGLMVRRWEQSKAGQGQVMLISGEAGIGKSALVDTLRAHVRREGLTRITARCSPYHTNSALYPVMVHVQQALRFVQQLTHPYTLARTLYYDALLCQLRRDVQAVRGQAEAAISVATAQGFALVRALGPIMRGCAIAVQEHSTEGLVQIRQGLDTYRSIGAEFQRPHFLAMLAEASGLLGQSEGGLAALEEALTLVQQTEERYYEAELHRQRGELLLHAERGGQNAALTAEECFQYALDVARQQQAKSLELRAAMSLSRLWQQQGKRQEAYDLLAPIYAWFTEGFDTADLQEARALLETLRA
jgi:class 3 adenylate cyclase